MSGHIQCCRGLLVQMHKKAQQTHSNQMNKNNLPEEEESAALKLGLEDKVAVLK